MNAGRSLSFTYDALSRVTSAQTAATSGADCWGQSYGYDNWGNLTAETPTQCSAPQLSVTATANNQVSATGVTYDAAGDTTDDGTHGYTFDAEGNLTQVDGGGTAAYTYNAEGQRVQKAAGGVTTQYVYFGGAPIAELNTATSRWTDYIFANGRRLVMTGESAAPAAVVPNGGFEQGTTGWTIWNGAQLVSDATKAHSGNNYMQISAAANGTAGFTAQTVAVTPGEQITFGGWAYLESGGGGALGWWLGVGDANGNPIAFVGTTSPSGSGWTYQTASYTVPAGAATVGLYAQVYLPTSATVLRVDDGFLSAGTFYYHGDALGSARMMTDPGGNVAWSGEFLPFGQEWNAEATVNHYKFTGYERDAESNLDYAMARHYTSQYGRFMQPDPAGLAAVDPTNPQSWNRYAYVLGNPLNFVDPGGMDWVATFADKTKEEDGDWEFTTYTLTQLRFVVSLVPGGFYLVPGSPGNGFVDQTGYGLAGSYEHIPGPGDVFEPCSDYGCPPKNTTNSGGSGGGGGTKTTIGPPTAPTPPRPVSDTDKYLAYLGCLAGADPGTIDPEKGDMTPTDSAPGSLGQRTAKLEGRKKAMNPAGSRNATPDNAADAAAWLSGAARCAAIVHGWPSGGNQ